MLSPINLKDVPQDTLSTMTWVIFSRDLILVGTSTSALPTSWIIDCEALKLYSTNVMQLHDLNGNKTDTLVLDLGAEQPSIDNFEYTSLRDVMMNSSQGAFDVIGRAWQFVHFYRTHRYCGQCGSATTNITWETAVQCSRCDHRCYPRVSPCIIVAIYRDDEILLGLNVRHTKNTMYSTLAGFVESGESLDQAVEREVFEEVGVKVCDIEYMGSQPWPFPHALMVGYLAKWKSGEITPDKKEILDAQWFRVNDLPNIPPTFSIAGKLIEAVVNRSKAVI